MSAHLSTLARPIAIAIATLVICSPAIADKGGKHGHEREHGNRHEERDNDRYDDNRRDGASVQIYFGDRHRTAVNDYYGQEFRSGHCPPGLAKKGNGCLPPGQAKKWRKGHALPRDVAYYELPRDLVVRLPAPPSGHKYVRVAGDILMIAIGTSMVVDAIQDIGR